MKTLKLMVLTISVLLLLGVNGLVFGITGGTTLVKIGTPHFMFGPDTHVPDSPFNIVKRSDGQLLGYTGAGPTYYATMNAMWNLTMNPNSSVCLPTGTGFDVDGAFMTGTIKNGSNYPAWYHAESGYSPSTPNRRYWQVGYCTSADGGGNATTFTKPNYPNNVCLQWEFGYHPEFTTPHGEGDPSVTKWGNYYYMIFQDCAYPGEADQRWASGIARSLVSAGGLPGTWWKWVNRNGNIGFLGAGNGGVADKPLYGSGVYVQSWASVNTWDNKLCAGPFALMFASDPNNMENWDWVGLNGNEEMLMTEQFGSDTDGQEAIGYGSMYNPDTSSPDFATNHWNYGFNLYYFYIPAGMTANKMLYRGLAEVPVNIQTVAANNGMPHVWRTLSQNYSSSLGDYWATTACMVNEARVGNTTYSGHAADTGNAVPALDYAWQADLGYVFPNFVWYNMYAIYDYYNTVNHDHWIGLATEWNQPNTISLRRLGYIWSFQYLTSVPLYRFKNANGTKHYCDSNPTPKSGYTLETTLGYMFPIGYNP